DGPEKVVGPVVTEIAKTLLERGGRHRRGPERAEVAPESAGSLPDRDHLLGVENGGLELGQVRITRVSLASRSTSLAVIRATRSGWKSEKASRIPGHLASTTRQLMPEENTIRVI